MWMKSLYHFPDTVVVRGDYERRGRRYVVDPTDVRPPELLLQTLST